MPHFVDTCSVRSTNVRCAALHVEAAQEADSVQIPWAIVKVGAQSGIIIRRTRRSAHPISRGPASSWCTSPREFVLGFLHQLCQDTALPSRLPFIILAEQLVQNVQQGIHVARFRFSSVRMMERFSHLVKIINSAA